MKLITKINPEEVSDEEALTFRQRQAARAVVFDEAGLIGLMHSRRDGIYKLPGGGIDEGESPEEALKRECYEELGTQVRITHEIGLFSEYRRIQRLKQESFCYVASTMGSKGVPELTKAEQEAGYEVVWVTFEEAEKLVTESFHPDDAYNYFQRRDLMIIGEAKKILRQ